MFHSNQQQTNDRSNEQSTDIHCCAGAFSGPVVAARIACDEVGFLFCAGLPRLLAQEGCPSATGVTDGAAGVAGLDANGRVAVF